MIAGGSAVGQKLLETIFGEDAVRRLAQLARRDLGDRVRSLLDHEAYRDLELLEQVRRGPTPGQLRADAEALTDEVARSARRAERELG